MKTLTLHQPWASLIAIGAKKIETRSWSTSYRGPLAIHAASRVPAVPGAHGWIGPYNVGKWTDEVKHAAVCDCDEDDDAAVGDSCMGESMWNHALMKDEGAHGFSLATTLPLGAIVATCELIDVVPTEQCRGAGTRCVSDAWEPTLWLHGPNALTGEQSECVESERPFGDFTPGRFAWLLHNVVPLSEPIPARGRQGLWEWDNHVLPADVARFVEGARA